MTDDLQQAPPQPEVQPIEQVSTPSSDQPRKSKRRIWIIIGVILVVLCLCTVVCVAVIGTGAYKVYTEKAPVELVLDSYMRYMENKDVESAYALFSPRAQRQIPISKLQEALEGNNYFLFDGYRSLSIMNINMMASANLDPDLPQGLVAKVAGIISYDGDVQGGFNGVLEEVGDEWMIDSMYVTVPPNKIK